MGAKLERSLSEATTTQSEIKLEIKLDIKLCRRESTITPNCAQSDPNLTPI